MVAMYHMVQRVETLQEMAEKETKAFKKRAGIDCLCHCSDCCYYEQIEATPLEFLPLAWHAYKLDLLEDWLDALEKHESVTCFFARFENGRWGCKIYHLRGMICRLFGFSGITDKNGKSKFAVCHSLKEKSPGVVEKAKEYVDKGGKMPLLCNFYRRLSAIDFVLANQYMPINQAIKKALELVYFHFCYRR
ncbi:MAG: YkgJ family cysteine cluster protein [Candidatus Riflebacteria bacterium]|nr:YkgJ family cysteine cluster protein [Candidatus Riflebacteria bacterium]